MPAKGYSLNMESFSAKFAAFHYLPYTIVVVDVFNNIFFINEEGKKLFAIPSLDKEQYQLLENCIRSSLHNVAALESLNKPGYGFSLYYNEKEYIYDLVPVFRGKLKSYKIIIIREKNSLSQSEQEIYFLMKDNYVLQRLIDSSYDGIYITDGQGKTLYFNDAFVRISGFKREECIGVTVQDLVASNYIPKSCAWEVIKQRKSVSMTIDYPNGVEGMLSGSPVFDENGHLVRTILNVRDMTELNRLNEELKNAEALTTSYRQQLKEVQLEYQRNSDIIFESKVMGTIMELALKVSQVDSPALILGESGTGKDVLAKFIHNIGERGKKGNLIKINCGAIPETLLESELFGYEKGAFTGAMDRGKVGLFELADGGTFFLDEIGDMPLNLQVKLLDVLHEGRITRLGGTKPIPVDVRIIAATNRDLEQMIKTDKFRLDLYYRLNVVSIHIPPLRERFEDILPLVEHFLETLNSKYRTKKVLAPQVLDRLLGYHWPGNVRELRNVIERLIVTSQDKTINLKDLSPHLGKNSNHNFKKQKILTAEKNDEVLIPLKEALEAFEKKYISQALMQYKTLKGTAAFLNIDISTLVRKKQKYNL
ncbi:MAG: sigma-54 interaction domain-containing protein [Peptococcaceae bacterium]